MKTSLVNLVNKLFNNSVKKQSGIDASTDFYLSHITNYPKNFGKYAKKTGEIATYPLRHPLKSSNFVLSELKDKYFALGNLVAANAGDFITTTIAMNRHGPSYEFFNLAESFMESYGVTEGQLIAKSIEISFLYTGGKLLGIVYGIIKHSHGNDINEKIAQRLENSPLHVGALWFYGVTANNLYQILN